MHRSLFGNSVPLARLSASLPVDLSSVVWYLLGTLQIQLAQILSLSAASRNWIFATPILAGAVLCIVTGLLVDRMGARRASPLAQLTLLLLCNAALVAS